MAIDNLSNASEILSQLTTLRSHIASSSLSDAARTDLLRETRGLIRELETPSLSVQRICGLNIWETVILTIATNMGLFTFIVANKQPVSPQEIATGCEAELLLVERLLRCLVVFGAVQEHDSSHNTVYSATDIARTFAAPTGAAAIRSSLEFLAPGWVRLPQQLREQRYKVLLSGNDTVYNKVYDAPGQTLWEILASTPYVAEWGLFMEGYNGAHQDWLDFYPARQRLIEEAIDSSESTFMVDIGGCSGVQTVSFLERFPQTPGKFIVQDLPHMLLQPVPSRIEQVAHDFFQPFPLALHGARVYYMRYISHDWPQARLVQILSNIRAAMKPKYSKLIIHDWIVPEKNVPPFMATQDLNMMVLGGGEERSEERHRQAIEAAGLVVTGIWDPKDGKSEGILECELVE